MKKQTLNIDQAASLCGVSPTRVKAWIDKKELRAGENHGREQWIRHTDLIDFLVKFNMPIPDALLPYKARKILFIYNDDSGSRLFMRFLIRLLGQLKKTHQTFVADHIPYGPDAKIKVMVFKPDLVLLDMTENDHDAISMGLQIKNATEFSAVKLIAVTTENNFEEQRVSAQKSGIDTTVPDSVNIPVFAEELNFL